MDYIDFSKSIGYVLNQLLQSNKLISTTDSNALFDYYKFLHFFRHNFLHYLVLKAIGLEWENEKPLGDSFPFLPANYFNKTPDICFKRENVWYLIDVSISVDTANSEKIKKEKYGPIVLYLKERGIPIAFYHINIDNNQTNLLQELNKLSLLTNTEFDTNSFFRALDIIMSKKEWVHDNIDKEIFETLKAKEYGHLGEKEIDNKEGVFLNELKHENIGQYNDLEIEEDIFENHNSKFETEKDIINSINPNTEEELVGFFSGVLENNNHPLFQKYKDEKLQKEQFENAYVEIVHENEKKKKRQPKPTHHLLIPLPDDVEEEDEKRESNEQKKIISFVKDYLKNVEELSGLEKKRQNSFFKRFILRVKMGSI